MDATTSSNEIARFRVQRLKIGNKKPGAISAFRLRMSQ
jgi:hypothetical protein